MKRQTLYILTIFILNFLPSYGQQGKIYFDKVVNIIKFESSSSKLSLRLDSLKSKHIPSRSNFDNYLDRDLDFGYRHQRLNLEINFERFQIDIFKKNDTILVASVKTGNYKKLTFSYLDTPKVGIYLKDRNKFYRSTKTARTLVNEISKDEIFAIYCGDTSPKTSKGREIEKLVEDENTEELIQLLKNFNIETQAYGVAGFEMLVEQGYILTSEISKIIKHIKKRNSETIICSGCLSGLVKKLYEEKQ